MSEKKTIEETINGLQSMIHSKMFIEHDFNGVVDEDICERAIELLKEQEPVPVYEDKISKCECGETVHRYWHPKFCGFCGRELLWY